MGKTNSVFVQISNSTLESLGKGNYIGIRGDKIGNFYKWYHLNKEKQKELIKKTTFIVTYDCFRKK